MNAALAKPPSRKCSRRHVRRENLANRAHPARSVKSAPNVRSAKSLKHWQPSNRHPPSSPLPKAANNAAVAVAVVAATVATVRRASNVHARKISK
jgi:hypothetical protein